MMKSKFKLSLILLAILFFNGKCNPKKENIFVKKMVEFDKAFVPVLYYVYQNDISNAKKSVFYLEYKWQQFHQRFTKVNLEDSNWNNNFCLINQRLDDVCIAIDKGHRLIALIQLNKIRHQMMDLRKEIEVEYYLDYVWNFEETLDLTFQVASSPELFISNYDEFESIVFQLNTRWQVLKKQPFPDEYYGLDSKKQKDYLLRLNQMNEILKEFNRVVEERELYYLDYTTQNMIRGYLNMVHCFGEFQAEKPKYVLK